MLTRLKEFLLFFRALVSLLNQLIKSTVVNRRGEALLEAEYVGYKAAEEAAKEAGIEIKKFVDVENYLPSSTPNNLKDANW